ncbi:Non-ribosomal peptide synthetase [Ceratobasidium theobromae]|uniref:Non-ribosomal peptide synthetase n=1 Tax=Ceratobasidium theobromae TaxID=1582974 RepID=A0A5N5QBS7_9AGAM|nr:Non-ribosomal peptide synthetase [Ceratobasidium theobromae]
MVIATIASFADTSHIQRLESLLEFGSHHYPIRNALTYYVGGEKRHITYSDLWARSNSVASALRGHLSPGKDASLMTLFLPNGPNQIIAIFATLISGAAYVPIALDAVPAQCRSIVDQSGSRVIITDSSQRQALDKLLLDADIKGLEVLDMDTIDDKIEDKSEFNGITHLETDPAYVLFSSGTTGVPKGIIISHAAVLSFCRAGNESFRATSTDKFLRAASYTFDGSIEELFISVGAEVVIQPPEVLENFSTYVRFLDQASITILIMSTALWHQLAKYVVQTKQNLPRIVQLVSIGGEAGMTDVLASWRKHVGDYPRIVNTYGPTESTVTATAWEASDYSGRAVLPIGRPLPNTKCYILDAETRAPVERGQMGLLHLSGPNLAVGYLGNAELTRKKFLPNPFNCEPGYERMYNTGDLVVEDEDGLLHFGGRADLQVKVRGFRVEIETIEACLLTHPGVVSVGVLDVTEQQTTSLHAFIVQFQDSPPLYGDDFIAHCQKSLAHYEIPARFFRIETMPLNLSQKIDRRRLAKVSRQEYLFKDTLTSGHLNDVGGIVDMTLAGLWCECLGGLSVAQLNAQSHFLRLGGHSLTLITLSAKISSVFRVSLRAVELLRNLELGAMSKLIAERRAVLSMCDSQPGFETVETESDSYPLTLPQERLFAVQQKSPDSPFFNDGLAIDIRGRVDEERLVYAVKEILQRHVVLRARLVQREHGAVDQQIVEPSEEFFSRVFIRESLNRSRAEQLAHRIYSQPLNLFTGPLIKVAFLTSDPEEHILVVCVHHIIWDGFSDNIFVNEFVRLYKGERLEIAPSYFDSFPSGSSSPNGSRLEAVRSYLAGVPQIVDIASDFVRPETQSYSRGRSLYFDLDSDAMGRLLNRVGGSLACIGLTAYAVAVHLSAARQMDFAIGVPFANRALPAAARAIGFFVNLLPIRMKFADISSLDELYGHVREDLLFLAEMEDVPFDALINTLGVNRTSSRGSLIQVSFSFHDAPEGLLSDGTTFSRFSLSNGAARTDLLFFVEVGKTGQLTGELEYNTELFAHSTIESMAEAVTQILSAWASDSSLSIDEIPFKAPPLSAAPLSSVCDQSFGSYISAFGRRFADRVAVYDDNVGKDYTYSQIFNKAQRIRRLVRPLKCQSNSVMLLVDRSADILAVEIGVSLAGLTWIPCDVGQPKSRIFDIVADAQPACIVAHSQVMERLKLGEAELTVPIIYIPSDWTDDSGLDNFEFDDAGELAYIIYTSGTTGKPKGVTIGHSSVIAVLDHMSTWIKDTPLHGVLTLNYAFDPSITQIYAVLISGGLLKLPKIGGEQDAEYLSGLMKKSPCTNFLCTTPAAVRMWLDQRASRNGFFPADFREVLVGGDALTPEFVRRVMAELVSSPKVQLKNVYGPTEGTIFSSYGVLNHTNMDSITRACRVPIDRLMPHVEMTVCGPTGQSLPRGFVGEIIIWGSCLTLGYANLPEINKARFLSRKGVRGWRSGDLGRQLACGNFEILGRTDSMCKVRGNFRVELLEIKSQITSFEEVTDCHVSTAITSEDGEKQISAYAVFRHDSNRDVQSVASWKEVTEAITAQHQDVEFDAGFDHRGWTSSFDRGLISTEDMKEWLDATVDRLLSLRCFQDGQRPRILEIGSGTGMILFRLAPHAEKYVGFDLSALVVSQVQAHAQKLGYDHVEVYTTPAHLFEEVIDLKQRFDLVICNSVAQYFPSFQYFQRLLDRAADHLDEDGYIFFGDMRNFGLMRQYAMAVALAGKPQSVSCLSKAILNTMSREEELLVSPDYFAQLARDDGRFDSAVSYLKRGVATTEMNLFRFDAILHSPQQKALSASASPLRECSWSPPASLDELVSSVEVSLPVLLRNIPNARIADVYFISTLSLDAARSLSDILDLAKASSGSSSTCHPEDLIRRLSTPDMIAIPLCSLDRPECFDVLVVGSNTPQVEIEQMCYEAQLATTARGDQILSNKQKAEASRETLQSLREYLSRRVPAYVSGEVSPDTPLISSPQMIPDFLVPVDMIPLTTSHKVDISKLPKPNSSHRFTAELQTQVEWSAADIARRPIVEAILRIFSTVLFTDKVLSPKDDFFACGGHSLIATKATNMIRLEFDVPLPFTAIIMNPTASELAARIESIKAESHTNSQLPPNIVMIHPAATATPRVGLFVFHMLWGAVALFTPLVKHLVKELGDLVIYGIVWEPERDLTSLEKMASSYATSISAVNLPATASRFLLGGCYGGIVATQVAKHLPHGSSRLILLETPSSSVLRNTPESSFSYYMAQNIEDAFDTQSSDVDARSLAEELSGSGISRHDAVALTAFFSQQLAIPPWVTDIELERLIRALSENFEVSMDIWHHAKATQEPDSEVNIALNLQATLGIWVRDELPKGLGWAKFEDVEGDHISMMTSSTSAGKIVEVLRG